MIDGRPAAAAAEARSTEARALGACGEDRRRAVEYGAAAAQRREHLGSELEALEGVAAVYVEAADTGCVRACLDGHK
jgi:hypothetical protein